MYGGAALNAAHALVHDALDGLIARDGRLAEPLRRGIVAADRARSSPAGASCRPGADELAEQGARPSDPRAAEEFYLRTFAEPALDVNGIETGSPHLQKTVLPVEAVANLSIRLAPGPDASRRSRRRSSGSCARRRPTGAELEVELWSSSPPGPRPAGREGDPARPRRVRARRSAAGPALIRSGGTLPIVPALAGKGIPTIITGFGLPDSNVHSPNERLVAEYVPLGIAPRASCSSSLAAL